MLSLDFDHSLFLVENANLKNTITENFLIARLLNHIKLIKKNIMNPYFNYLLRKASKVKTS
jgi:hypothetical protein